MIIQNYFDTVFTVNHQMLIVRSNINVKIIKNIFWKQK